jgi:hypothetical protein
MRAVVSLELVLPFASLCRLVGSGGRSIGWERFRSSSSAGNLTVWLWYAINDIAGAGGHRVCLGHDKGHAGSCSDAVLTSRRGDGTIGAGSGSRTTHAGIRSRAVITQTILRHKGTASKIW